MFTQYLSIETCKSQNEIQIFGIMEFYTGIYTSDPAYLSADVKEYANDIRNEAAAILNSQETGDNLLLLQANFLAKFNEFYKIGDVKYFTKWGQFLAAHQEYDSNTNLTALRQQHNDIITGKYGQGKFIQG